LDKRRKVPKMTGEGGDDSNTMADRWKFSGYEQETVIYGGIGEEALQQG
jgi:hypothetical protein